MKLTKEIKEILSTDGLKLENYPQLQNNKRAILAAVKQNSRALLFITNKRFLKSKNFIKQAVKQNGYAIRFASDELRDDDELVMIAMRTSGCDIIKHASQRIQNYFN